MVSAPLDREGDERLLKQTELRGACSLETEAARLDSSGVKLRAGDVNEAIHAKRIDSFTLADIEGIASGFCGVDLNGLCFPKESWWNGSKYADGRWLAVDTKRHEPSSQVTTVHGSFIQISVFCKRDVAYDVTK